MGSHYSSLSSKYFELMNDRSLILIYSVEISPNAAETSLFPRAMQVLTYEYSNDKHTRQELDRLRSDHKKYLKEQSLKPNAKLNSYFVQSLKQLEEQRGFSVQMSFYFDHANRSDLEDFARHDPWVKAGLVTNWKYKLDTIVFDPCQTIKKNRTAKYAFEI